MLTSDSVDFGLSTPSAQVSTNVAFCTDRSKSPRHAAQAIGMHWAILANHLDQTFRQGAPTRPAAARDQIASRLFQ
jgi:hypothetical protein